MTLNNKPIPNRKSVFISVCCVCSKVTGIKDGMGTTGLSHGYCKKCIQKIQHK